MVSPFWIILGLLLKFILPESGDWVSGVSCSNSWVENFFKALFLGNSVGEVSAKAKFFVYDYWTNLGLFIVGNLIVVFSSSISSSSFYYDI